MKANDHSGPLTYADLRRWLGLVVAIAFAVLLVWLLGSILLLFALVFLVAMVLNPLVAAMERSGLHRSISVGVLALGAIALFSIALWFVIPPVLDQVNELVQRIPEYVARLQGQATALTQRYPFLQQALPSMEQLANTAGQKAGGVASFLVRSTVSFVGGITAGFIALLLLVFVLSNPRPLVAAFLELMPDRHREAAKRSLVRLMNQMRAWVRGVLINGAITGVSTGLLMWAIGVQPALVFGALSFVGEFVPNIGPVIAALPALFVALSMGATTFWLALLAVLFVQQVETNLLVPLILGKEMNLSAVNIMFFTLAMASLFGLAGAFLAVPAAALTQILLDEFYLKPRNLDREAIEAEAQRIVSSQIKIES